MTLRIQFAISHLLRSADAGRNPHILTFAPPLLGNLTPEAFGPATAYAIAKVGMSLATLGLAGSSFSLSGREPR